MIFIVTYCSTQKITFLASLLVPRKYMRLDPYGGFQMVNGQTCPLLLHVIKDKKLWVYTPSLNFKIHEGSDYVYLPVIPWGKGLKIYPMN